MRIWLVFAVTAMALAAGSAMPSRSVAQPSPAEFRVALKPVARKVNGVDIDIAIVAYFSVANAQGGPRIDVRLEADLGDVQAKIGPIIDAIPLPMDNCASYKPDNLVVHLSDKSLQAEEPSALLKIAGKVDVWQCLENPFSKKHPIKNKGISQPFEATLPVVLQVIGDRTVGLSTGQPDIKLKGQYVWITERLLYLAGVNVNEEAKKALQRAIGPNELVATIPAGYAEMRPVVSAASFGERDRRLILYAALSARMPDGGLNDFARMIMEQVRAK